MKVFESLGLPRACLGSRPGRRFGSAPLAALLLSGLVCIGAGPSTPAQRRVSPPPLSLTQRLEHWTRPSHRPALDSRGRRPGPMRRAEALRTLAGGTAEPGRCATDMAIALYQAGSSLNMRTRFLLGQLVDVRMRPPSAALDSPGGRFRIHYWTSPSSPDQVDLADADLDGVPDGVERLASEFTDVLADFVHVLDWAPNPPPSPNASSASRRDVVNIYLSDLTGGSSRGIDGFTIPLLPLNAARSRGGRNTADARIFLDVHLASPSASSRAAVVHQVAHMVQMRESFQESPWWHEASATWLENYLAGTGEEVAKSLGENRSRRAQGLESNVLGLSLETFLWPHYLSRSTGGDVGLIRQFWEEMGAVPGNNTLEAMDRVLRHSYGTTLQDELAVFNVWNLFLGQADDGRHYAFGTLLPTPQGDATYDLFPAGGGSLSGPLSPSGSAILRLLGDGSRGGLRIRFQGTPEPVWDISLIVYAASSPADARYVPISVDADGAGRVALPWRKLAAIDVLIQNLSEPGSSPADYSFSIVHDPLVPFDLMRFSATPASAGTVLTWSTDSEDRLAGWNIYRSTSVVGPFSRINSYLVPAAGRSGASMSYVYLDTSVEPGLKYYYRLQGITLEGFSESSHPAGVRLPLARGQAPAER